VTGDGCVLRCVDPPGDAVSHILEGSGPNLQGQKSNKTTFMFATVLGLGSTLCACEVISCAGGVNMLRGP
jgi:hypothetical protein